MGKLDIRNTYIKNDHARLRELYLKLADECGVLTYSPNTKDRGFMRHEDTHVGFRIVGADGVSSYHESTELTLAQLEAHFADADKPEWKNGDECVYLGSAFNFCGMLPTIDDVSCLLYSESSTVTANVNLITKPETPAQKSAREREQGARTIFSAMADGKDFLWDADDVNHEVRDAVKEAAFALYDAGYCKQESADV